MLLADSGKQKDKSLPMFQRIAQNDRAAVAECVEKYGDLLWTLVQKITSSKEESEILVRKIFTDIWKYAGCFDADHFEESVIVMVIARRNLRKFQNK